jgi:hypothetical protein
VVRRALDPNLAQQVFRPAPVAELKERLQVRYPGAFSAHCLGARSARKVMFRKFRLRNSVDTDQVSALSSGEML